jgi:hypothetical protein
MEAFPDVVEKYSEWASFALTASGMSPSRCLLVASRVLIAA